MASQNDGPGSQPPTTPAAAHVHLDRDIVVCADRAASPRGGGSSSPDLTFRPHHHHTSPHHHGSRPPSGGGANSPRPSRGPPGFRGMVRSTSDIILRWHQGDVKPGELGPEALLEDAEKRGGQQQASGDGGSEKHHGAKKKLSIGERTLRVTWAWFPVNLSTGALASLLSQQPYTFRGLFTIGKIFFITNIFLFCLFTGLIVARFARKPRALTTSLHHPSESFFFGSFWVAINLLILGIQTYGVPAAGPWLVDAMKIIFWTYYAATGLVAVLQYHVIFQVEKLTPSDAMPAWILPAYPFLVVGNLAAAIAETQPQGSAIEIIIGGIAGQGLGWILAFFIYTVYLTRLIHSSMPEPSVRPGMYVSVGPAAYTCAGLINLGKAARDKIPPDFIGMRSPPFIPMGDLWYAMSIPVGLFLLLIAVWFSALSTIAILRHIRRMSFTLQWWSCIFPNAGLAIAVIQVGNVLDSDGIKIAGSVITAILVPLWFFCAVMHIRAIAKRELLAPGRDIGVDDVNQKHDIKKERRRLKKWAKRNRRRLQRKPFDDNDSEAVLSASGVQVPPPGGKRRSAQRDNGHELGLRDVEMRP